MRSDFITTSERAKEGQRLRGDLNSLLQPSALGTRQKMRLAPSAISALTGLMIADRIGCKGASDHSITKNLKQWE
jgi:hypothetical protein